MNQVVTVQKMSHFAIHRVATAGVKYSRRLSASPIKPYSLSCNGAISPLSSYITSYKRSFMNKIENSSTTSVKSPEQILNECSRLYDSLSGLNEKLGGTAIPKSSPHTRWVQEKEAFLLNVLYFPSDSFFSVYLFVCL